MRKYLKFFESVNDPCQKRTWDQHHQECEEENLGKISKHSIGVVRKMISHLEELENFNNFFTNNKTLN